MSTIKVICRKIPNKLISNTAENIINYQNLLSYSAKQQHGFQRSTSYLIHPINKYDVILPICNISEWATSDDWENWFHSDIRKNIQLDYARYIYTETHERLSLRHKHCDTPLL